MQNIKLSILDPVTISPGLSSSEAIRQSIELAGLADQLGFSRYWIVEHHAVHYEATPAPEILVAVILQHTQRINVGIGGILLNYHNPYKIAEVVKSLHTLFPQRFEIGVGRSSSGELADFALNNIRLSRQQEADYDTVLTEFLHWLGGDFPPENVFSKIPIMRDVPDFPAIWLLAASPHSARKAASLGLKLAWAAFINPEHTINGFDQYRQNFAPDRFRVSQAKPQTMLAVRVIIADTQQQAEQLAMPARWLFKLRREQNIMPAQMLTAEQAIKQAGTIFPAEQVPWPMYVIGDQQQVYRRLCEMLEQTKTTELIIQDVLPNIEYRKYTFRTLAKLFRLDSQ